MEPPKNLDDNATTGHRRPLPCSPCSPLLDATLLAAPLLAAPLLAAAALLLAAALRVRKTNAHDSDLPPLPACFEGLRRVRRVYIQDR
jgi:type VI protein secretion system component VasF